MSQLILRPNSDNSVQLFRNTGSYNYACVNDGTPDYGTSFVANISTYYTWLDDYYGQPGHGSASGAINSVTFYIVCKVSRYTRCYGACALIFKTHDIKYSIGFADIPIGVSFNSNIIITHSPDQLGTGKR